MTCQAPAWRLYFHFPGNQCVQHRLHVLRQAVVTREVGDDVSHGSSHVGQDQVNDPGRGGVKRRMAVDDPQRRCR